MTDWLPSETDWLNRLAERVVDGEILLVRSLPRWGISAVCAWISDQFGESAVLVNGRDLTEQNQKGFREKLDSDVTQAIDGTGFALVIFDNYARAIRRSQGGTLHSLLYRILVDSPTARDTGAILTARPNDMLDPGFAGSPLIGRARSVVLPELTEADAAAIGVTLGELSTLAGTSTWLARRFASDGYRQGRSDCVEHLSADRKRLVESLPPGAVAQLANLGAVQDLDTVSREALRSLGTFDGGGAFNLASLVAESALLDEIHLQNPTWPGNLVDSARRFTDLLAGSASAVWADRWIFSSVSGAREFLDLVRGETSTHLRILTSDDRERGAFAHSIRQALEGLEGIEVRFLHWSDRKQVHDRQLVLTDLRTGYTLPTANVVLAVDPPGTAVAARIPAIDYSEYWRRASVVFPVPSPELGQSA